MKDHTSLIGTLGGLSTALYLIFYWINGCCTRKKFSKFVEVEREIYKAELLQSSPVPSEESVMVSEEVEEEKDEVVAISVEEEVE